ncbi:CDP-alcohol phosphatidyltransferase family protein [Rhizosaccharibacter radicis]|uniref:CDP-alcohol phosphatidyltransferase family protein n=1 Tax=Rhizosaccharibacter radicis TaxID=2782605 RepID=A0ABT1VUG1_9PROT|nr:CDP-alcohol phosphatidyltransferase family protein [Acetobacteraceae bacterium KSS12]
MPALSHHTLLHRSVRPAVRLLAATAVTPDQLTIARLLTGLAAAVAFAIGPMMLGAGLGLMLVSCLLDRADGELARQTRRFSRFGGRFDLVADCVATAAIFVGLGIGTDAPDWAENRVPLLASVMPELMGVAAAVGIAAIFSRLNLPGVRDEARPGEPRRLFDPDDSLLLVLPVIGLGAAWEVLLAAAIVTPVVALSLWGTWFARGRRRAALVSCEAD